MSAIWGILRFDGAAPAPRDLERMGNVLAHRAPDGRRAVTDGAMGLGQGLLRVTQEDFYEAQPLRAGTVLLAADLRLDNREELAAAFGLDEDALRDMPDSALLLRAHNKWGADCPKHLLGDFAFAIWDGRTLLLARDPMGQRALVYHVGDGFIAFASEIKALWALDGVPHEMPDDEIGRMLTLMMDRRAPGGTFYRGIVGLPGGTTLNVGRAGAVTVARYWEPKPDPVHENRDEAYYIATYRKVLEEAVACRLRRLAKPAALMLSGGFDSSAIAGLAGPTLTRQKRKLVALSQVVSDRYRGTDGDIRPFVEACARVMPHLDLRILMPPKSSPLVDIERRFMANDGPAAVGHNFNHRFFVQAKAAGARVIMDGIGGDHTVNPRGYAALAWLLRHGHVARFAGEIGPYMRATGQSLLTVLRSGVLAQLVPSPWLNDLRNRIQGRPAVLNASVVAPDFLRTLLDDGVIGAHRKIPTLPRTAMRTRLIEAIRRSSATAFPGSAVAAASHGLELTRPFHDRRVVEFGLAVPEALYMKQGRNRYLARRALADVYPPEILTRGPYNDAATPEGVEALGLARTGLLREAERLSENDAVTRYINLGEARRLLSLPLGKEGTGLQARQVQAARGIMMARFLEWFRRDNRN
ncbi:MAG TPA: asparagine synthase-related protein [Rhizomicrobium sp.]|jgi:asparagine synthase (glutamine-hydrolysing)|nr:asparagine synthase-related protein [Rhizomicrobium sp.]